MALDETVSDDTAWQAVCARDDDHDGHFVFAVRTTGVYCRPSCPARRPRRENVRFFALGREAEAAGFRPCKRCRPNEMSKAQRDALMVEAACRLLAETAAPPPTLAEVAAHVGVSGYHFHRIFKAHTGLTPRAYADAARARRAAETLGEGGGIADSAFGAGFGSLSQFYDRAAQRFGLPPAAIAAGAPGEVIVTAQAQGPLGTVCAAFSRRGLVALVLAEDGAAGLGEIEARFGRALLIAGGADFSRLMERVVRAVEEPAKAAELPLDIRGTAFEERVWQALRQIPVGSTQSYGEVAAAIGEPGAHRAVARACAANRIAIAIPCHRVVRADGSLAGYRWGVERKAALLAREEKLTS
ncbi:MAG: bifunctional DNA-binding transcriptional regulator/O6-methylguanine-DNA methyltransferase Ada [Acuticoccus sp.]